MELILEGKAKQVYESEDYPEGYIIRFKNDVTAFNKKKSENMPGKGALNCNISSFIFRWLEAQNFNFSTHYLRQLNDTDVLVKRTKVIPIEIVVRNLAAGSIVDRLGLKKGEEISPPLIEWFYKDDELNDPLISENHAVVFKWLKAEMIPYINQMTLKINIGLSNLFAKMNIQLVDFKIEIGEDESGNILLIDEISPDSCRLWVDSGKERLDKDNFRFGLGDLLEGYRKLWSGLKETYPEYVNYTSQKKIL